MTSKQNLRTNFAIDQKHEAFYTGGQVLFTEDGTHMLCTCNYKVNLLEVATGSVVHSFGKEEDGEVTCFIVSPDDKMVVLAWRNLQLSQYDLEQKILDRSWRAVHTSPVSSMGFDKTSTLLATGGSDATIKVWDVIQQYCTHNLKGHRGVVSIVKFHPDPEKLQLLSGGEDYNIRIWQLTTSTCLGVLEGHYSIVTALQFSEDTHTLYSAGRDRVINVWNLDDKTKTRTIPVYETIEGMLLLTSDDDYTGIGAQADAPHVVTAGSKGVLRVWNTQTSQCVYTQNLQQPVARSTDTDTEDETSETSSHNLTSVLYCPSLHAIATVSYDHNIILYNRHDLSLKKQFAGYNDEILDIKYLGTAERHIVVATNSNLVKVFDLQTWDVQILYGHTDIVLAIDVYKSGQMFASSSKDNTVRVWQANDDITSITCVATAYGHTKEILSLAFSKMSASFLVSGSEDLTIKVWTLPEKIETGGDTKLQARLTEKAHDKDINCIVVSPNDRLIATGSQDKTAKLWSATNLKLIGIFRGHKRGIWCVQFSPVDQCLATASSDGNIKLWSLSDYSCVRTFEGHDAIVLKVNFLNRGMQLLSSGSDGLMKLWTIKTSECVKTFDEHETKIWAQVVNKDESQVITGAGDSTIIVWKDVTETEQAEERAKQVDFILKEQELMNLMQQKKYLKALALAINLDQPFRALNILKQILSEPEGEEELKRTLAKLRQDQLDAVLQFSIQWNTNSKHCHVAQFVLRVLLQTMAPEQLLQLNNAKTALEGLLPYTEKHMERMNRLLQQAMFVQYTWNTIKLASDITDVEDQGEEVSGVSDEMTGVAADFPHPESAEESDVDMDAYGESAGQLGDAASDSDRSSGSEDDDSDKDDNEEESDMLAEGESGQPGVAPFDDSSSGDDDDNDDGDDDDESNSDTGDNSDDSLCEESERSEVVNKQPRKPNTPSSVKRDSQARKPDKPKSVKRDPQSRKPDTPSSVKRDSQASTPGSVKRNSQPGTPRSMKRDSQARADTESTIESTDKHTVSESQSGTHHDSQSEDNGSDPDVSLVPSMLDVSTANSATSEGDDSSESEAEPSGKSPLKSASKKNTLRNKSKRDIIDLDKENNLAVTSAGGYLAVTSAGGALPLKVTPKSSKMLRRSTPSTAPVKRRPSDMKRTHVKKRRKSHA